MKKKENSIETNFQELDKIIIEMSSDKCSIEKSLDLYVKGTKIINDIDKKIEKIESDLKVIS